MKRILYIVTVALLLAGCTKELPNEPNTTAKPGDPVTVTFGASIWAEASEMSAIQSTDSPATRSFTSAYTGRIAVLDNSKAWVANYDDIYLSIAQNGATTADPAVLTAGQQYSFYSVAVPNGKTLPSKADTYTLTFDKVAEGTDLIYGKVENTTINGDDNIAFAYNHVYGKVKFVLSKGAYVTDEQLALATIQVSGYYKTGSLDIKTGTITGTVDTEIVVANNTEYYALPQTFTTDSEVTTKVTIDGKKYTGKITTGNITAGKSTTVTIKVNVEEPPVDAYVGMFGGTIIGTGTKADPYRFSKELHVHLKDEADDKIDFWKWSNNFGDHSALAGSKTDGRANTWNLNRKEGGSLISFPAANRCYARNNPAEQMSVATLKWYLPAQEQMMGIWITHVGSGASLSGSYASSSEYNTDGFESHSWTVYFKDGKSIGEWKNDTYTVRCAREVTQ